MNIIYEFKPYSEESGFIDENGQNVKFSDIKDNFYKLNGRIGKVLSKGYTSVIEQGYSGGYESFMFVFQDDMSSIDMRRKMVLIYVY